MKPFDSYEISPCTRTEEPDKPGHFYFEVCEPHEADVWTLYGHIPGEGVMTIGDFATREGAEEAFQRITGIPFSETREAQDRIRVMHAGERLLEVLEEMALCDGSPSNVANAEVLAKRVRSSAKKAIAQATGRKA